jgi:hypothetical protein
MGKTMLISIPDQVWHDFQRAAQHCNVEDIEKLAAFSMVYGLSEYSQSWESSHPYQTLMVEGGWNIFYIEEGKLPRLSDGHPEPFTEKPNADRKRKTMNKKWWKAMKETEANMKANGGAIIV